MAVGLGLVPALVALGAAALSGSATSTGAATSSEVVATATSTAAVTTQVAATAATSAVATSSDVATPGPSTKAVSSSEATASAATVLPDNTDVISRFAGSVLVGQLSANLNVFDASLQLMQNPTVDSALLLLPRYKVADWLSLRGRFSIAYEFTDEDSSTYAHEAQLADGMVGAMFTGIPELFGVKSAVGAQVVLPFSKASRGKTLYFSPGLVAEVGREVKDVAGGTLAFKASGVYSRPVWGSVTPRVLDEPVYAPHCFGGVGECSDQLSGAANVRDALSWTLVGSGTWGKVSATLAFNVVHQFPYQFSDLPGVTRDATRPDVRNLTSASLAIGYEVTEWVGAELSYSMTRNLIEGDGTWGNPIYDRNQDMRLGLGASLDLERFYRAL